MPSYFLTSRTIFGSAIWRENPHVLKLFIYLVGNARYKKEVVKYPTFEVKRGELLTSLSEIAEENEYSENGIIKKWSRQRVSRMLDKLQEGEYIKRLSDTYGTHIKVYNYDIWQSSETYKAGSNGTDAEMVRYECGNGAESVRECSVNGMETIKESKPSELSKESKSCESGLEFKKSENLEKKENSPSSPPELNKANRFQATQDELERASKITGFDSSKSILDRFNEGEIKITKHPEIRED